MIPTLKSNIQLRAITNFTELHFTYLLFRRTVVKPFMDYIVNKVISIYVKLKLSQVKERYVKDMFEIFRKKYLVTFRLNFQKQLSDVSCKTGGL